MNPAVERFFTGVNPVLRDALIVAIQSHQPITVDRLPLPLLFPAYLLSVVAAEWNAAPLVLRHDELEERVRSLYGRNYPSACNGAENEVEVRHLPPGTAFTLEIGLRFAPKRGNVVEHTSARCIVDWDGEDRERNIVTRNGESKIVTFSGRRRASIALETCVVPELNGAPHYYGTDLKDYPPDTSELVQQVYKELTGVFEEEKKRGRK